ncbi:ABC transporter permease [Chryseosolibacter indicus]|uniref:ABC transporter permease n=1 Tax=Chryseosolibacter indicus TaxID=2782351 RepID=A0ABS5VR12_9BACT|nr:ABC transporter permease [Chryseosolibacter indicus]MBT1703265.1 ABC transporter permease [Chryseosolibacter indicus]
MLLNYIKIAVRSLLKFKGYATINLLGLSLGLAAGILIIVYVSDELSYDKFHAKAERIYRVGTSFNTSESVTEGGMDANGWGVGSALKTFPEVESVLYSKGASWLLVNYEGKRVEQKIHFVSEEFFNIFSFSLLKGNPSKALTQPYSVVITEDMEKKYFKGGDGLNKSLLFGDSLEFVVTGVMKNIPSNSHIQADMLLSFSTYPILDKDFDFNGGWGNINVRNYILLKENTSLETFRAKARNIYTYNAGDILKSWGVSAYVMFTPLKDLYLTAKSNGMGPLGSIERVYLVSGIAVFVILLACINFINLTTARSIYRAKEVGLRKVVGSTRKGLINQFVSESFVLTLIALVIGVALTGLLLPIFNQLMAKNYTFNAIGSLSVMSGVVALVVIVTLLSGYYPALVMSAMKPAQVLKGKMQNSTKGIQLRRALVVFQFVISVGLVMGTLIVINQLNYMQKQELGFSKDEIIIVNAAKVRAPGAETFKTFKDELKQISFVEDVTFTNSLPGHPGWQGQVSYPEGRGTDAAISVEYMAVDEDYQKTLGLQVVSGRTFSVDSEAEMKEGLVLNETAVSMYGWASPQDAIGKRITSPSRHPEGIVIGVVKDYHQFGLQQNIGPMVMDYNPKSSYMYAIRYRASDTQDLLAALQKQWKIHFPGYDFNYFFLNEDFERQYQAEQRLAYVFGLFASLTITIAIIGLLGLVSFMVISRTKEIGVRKVLGADVLSIASLLSKEFIALVVAANVIAIPVTWYLADQWLQTFANRVSINPLIFIITLMIAITITIVAISYQTVRAALIDPIKSLRYE